MDSDGVSMLRVAEFVAAIEQTLEYHVHEAVISVAIPSYQFHCLEGSLQQGVSHC